ncbi:MAG: hypothetical protein ACOYJL_02325 [Tractidigestivibacter sp.]|jgi:hypothetical protein
MTTIVDESSLDAYLLTPDCPQCGSEDVVCIVIWLPKFRHV